MMIKLCLFSLVSLAITCALVAYLNPINAWRWTILLSLCK